MGQKMKRVSTKWLKTHGFRLGVAVVPYLQYPEPTHRHDDRGRLWIRMDNPDPLGIKGWHYLAYFGPYIFTLEILKRRK